MSRDYARVMPTFWTGETGRKLRQFGPETQLVAMYLITSPHASATGLYWLPIIYLSHETGVSIEGASKALRSLSEADFAHYDETTETVWVPEMARIQIGDSLVTKDKRHGWLIKEVERFKKSRFFNAFVEKYRDAYVLPFVAEPKPLPSPMEAPSKPLRSQERETEREQETEREGEGTPAPVTPLGRVEHRDVESLFSRLRSEAGGGTYKRLGTRDWSHVDALANWANGEADPRAALERSLRGFLASDRDRDKGYPLAFWATDPGRYAAPPTKRTTAGPVGALSHTDHATQIAARSGEGARSVVEDYA